MGVAERDEVTEQDQTTVEGGESQDTLVAGEGEDTVDGGEDEEVFVQIGNEEPPASEETKAAPAWVKELRQRQKELARENAELKARLSTGQPAETQAPKVGAKPKLADHDYDEEAYEAARDKWEADKRAVDAWQAEQKAREEQERNAVKAVDESYAKSKKALKVSDFQDAEDEVSAQFSVVQQAIVKVGAVNPAAMVYALGKSPTKLHELASIKDPVKFAVAVGKLETEVKVTKRTSTKPEPERTVRGNSSAPTSTATLDRLRAEADKTGDRTKVAAYLREQRDAGK